MNREQSYNRIEADEDFMETIPHGSNTYPFDFFYENLALFDFNCIEWHWHTELEFVYVESGTVTFWIGEKQFILSEGNGVFINSKILHRFYSPDAAIIPNFLCMPYFIAAENSLIYSKYIRPILLSSLSFQIFSREIPWQADVLEIIRKIIDMQNDISVCELATSVLIQELWLELYKHADFSCANTHTDALASSQARLQLMMQYIHRITSAISLWIILQIMQGLAKAPF